jgi:hypothetical protein
MSTQSTANSLASVLPKGAPPELIANIENACHDAFARHGVSAFEMSREAAIAHEIGHTIVMAHEGLAVQSVRVFFRSMPIFGNVWGGWCAEKDGKEWTSGPDTSAESDLSRARIVIGGLAGEVACRLDKPGSSLDELVLSQWLGIYAASKLGNRMLSDTENINNAYAQQLWQERVWRVALDILFGNREPFMRLVEHLQQHERIKGGKLRSVLAQVRRIAP